MKEDFSDLSDDDLSRLFVASETTSQTPGSSSAGLLERLRKFREFHHATAEKPAGPALLYREREGDEVKWRSIGKRLTVGRLSKSEADIRACELTISDLKVSRSHFEISCAEQLCTLRDLGSRNGTLLNGEALIRPALLKAGDMISAGDTVFIFTGD